LIRTLITGVSGQDGSFLAESLVSSGKHLVFGLHRNPETLKFAEGVSGLLAIRGDITVPNDVDNAILISDPQIVFNLAAVTSPGGGWGVSVRGDEDAIANTTALGALHVVDAVRRLAPNARVIHASSSAIYAPEHYGLYGAAKLFAHNVMKGHRDGYGMQVANAVLFSHTSSRQSDNFLIRRIIKAAAHGDRLTLNDLDARRAWAYAPDVVRALVLMSEQNCAQDFDIAGEQYSIRAIVMRAFTVAGRDWQEYVTQKPRRGRSFMEYAATNHAERGLGWYTSKPFSEHLTDMVKEEMAL
jgi:GDPmannose 4,6-dehydratase